MPTGTSTLLWGILFGSVGAGYFLYGKKQQNLPALVAGIALCGLPYFVENVWLLVLAGIGLAVWPFIRRE